MASSISAWRYTSASNRWRWSSATGVRCFQSRRAGVRMTAEWWELLVLLDALLKCQVVVLSAYSMISLFVPKRYMEAVQTLWCIWIHQMFSSSSLWPNSLVLQNPWWRRTESCVLYLDIFSQCCYVCGWLNARCNLLIIRLLVKCLKL